MKKAEELRMKANKMFGVTSALNNNVGTSPVINNKNNNDDVASRLKLSFYSSEQSQSNAIEKSTRKPGPQVARKSKKVKKGK